MDESHSIVEWKNPDTKGYVVQEWAKWIHGDRSQNNDFLWQGEHWLRGSMKETSEATEMFFIFIQVVVSWVHAYVKSHWAVLRLSTLLYVNNWT